MEFISHLIEILLHVDKYLGLVIQDFGAWSYLLLFAVIFTETGLVVMPFFPGDSLLFAAGTFAAVGSFNLFWLILTLISAAVIGDSLNYAVGKIIGDKVFQNNNSRIFKKEYLERSQCIFS